MLDVADRHSETAVISKSRDRLGIVVIGRNEGQRLIDCLISLQSHTGKIIYVDSGSLDGSVAAAEGLGAFVVKLDTAAQFTAARARNEGFKAAIGQNSQLQFVQFIDGDCELVSSWLEQSIAFISSRTDVAVVCGRRRERHPERSVYNWLCDIEWDTPVGESVYCGGDSLVRVDAFKMVGGFRSELIAGEEPELCTRLRRRGWRIWRLDTEMTRHDAAITRFRQWWIRSARGGYATAEIAWLNLKSGVMDGEERDVARAAVWGGLIPLVIGIGTVLHPLFLTAALLYPLQIVKIAVQRNPKVAQSWIYAVFVTIAKFPQLQGNLKFFWNCFQRKRSQLMEYKNLS